MPTMIELRGRKLVAERIMRFLHDNCEGPERAIKREVVAAHICYDGPDRHFRDIYHELPIAACDKGLYWPRLCDLGEYHAYLVRNYGPILAAKKINALRAHPDRKDLWKPVAAVQGVLPMEGAGA